MFSNHYNELETLGKGTFGTVKRCIKKATNEEFAVKIIEKSMGHNAFQDVLYEAEICSRLQHPNIVRLLESFDESRQLYLIFDLVVGGELFHDIQNLQFYSEILASQCMHDILQAVSFCHRKGVVHRDLKPENILLTSKRKPSSIKIADFGLALEVKGDERRQFGWAGTATYMAPEIYKEISYGKPIDMWSCGVILYLLLIGDEPFAGKTQFDLEKKIKSGVYHFPTSRNDSISAQAKDIVKRMLTLNPDKRITAGEALKHPWIQQREVVAPRVHLARTVVHLKKFNARRKFRAAALAAVAAKKFFKFSGSNSKNVKLVRDNTSTGKRDPANSSKSNANKRFEEMLKQEIITLTKKLVNACEAGLSKTIEKLCETNVTTFDSNQSGEIVTGIDFENFFTENIPVESYSEWNTEIAHPWVHLLSSETACIAYVRSTEYINREGQVHLQETEETLVWLRKNGKWKVVHFHSGLTFSYKL